MIEILLIVVAAGGITYGVMKHLQVKSLNALISSAKSDPAAVIDAVRAEFTDLEAGVRAKVDASSKWLRAEIAKLVTPPPATAPSETPSPPVLTDPAAPVASDAVPPAAAPIAPSPTEPSAVSGGTVSPQEKLAALNAGIETLTAQRDALSAQKQKVEDALTALNEALK